MATLLNESEQIALLFEVISMREDWAFARIAFQHYQATQNSFAAWLEGFVDVYRDDLARLLREMATSLDCDEEGFPRLCFEPVAEPSFGLRTDESSPRQRGCMLASMALDIKRVLDLTVPAAYRDNRVTLQFRTSRDKFRRFVEEFSLEAGRTLRQCPSGV